MFRLMVIAGLSPFLLLGMGFDWSRGMSIQALKSLLAAWMVLFGASLAVGLCLYGVFSSRSQHEELRRSHASILDAKTLLVVILGLAGSAFVAEATAVANSIANSHYTNAAPAVIAAGLVLAGGWMTERSGATPSSPPPEWASARHAGGAGLAAGRVSPAAGAGLMAGAGGAAKWGLSSYRRFKTPMTDDNGVMRPLKDGE